MAEQNKSISSYECRELAQDREAIIPEKYVGLVTHEQYLSIKQTVKECSQVFRDRLRTKTGLKPYLGKEGVALSVSNRVPHPLEELIRQMSDPILRLMHLQPSVSTAISEAHRLEEILFRGIPDATKILKLDRESEMAFSEYKKVLRQINHHIKGLDIQKKLTEINEDVFGAYFHRDNRIEIYWLPIALFADRIGVSIENLTKIVLIHELAHGYTHVGRDINGNVWHTKAFAHSDPLLIEGLAQFYTAVIAKDMSRSGSIENPGDEFKAYESLLIAQSPLYRGHLIWLELDNKLIAEAIRFALLEVRQKNEPIKYECFTDLIHHNLKRLAP